MPGFVHKKHISPFWSVTKWFCSPALFISSNQIICRADLFHWSACVPLLCACLSVVSKCYSLKKRQCINLDSHHHHQSRYFDTAFRFNQGKCNEWPQYPIDRNSLFPAFSSSVASVIYNWSIQILITFCFNIYILYIYIEEYDMFNHLVAEFACSSLKK